MIETRQGEAAGSQTVREDGDDRAEAKPVTMARSREQLCSGHICLLVILITVGIIGAMSYSLRMGGEMAEKYTSQTDAAIMIRYEAAIAHLWFEEMITGDPDVDMEQVRKHLDEAQWYGHALLEGGSNCECNFIALTDEHLRGDVRQTLASLRNFRTILEKRCAAREESRIGSEIDQAFDTVFRGFLDRAKHVETELGELMSKDIRTFRSVQMALIGVVIGLSVLVVLVLHVLGNQRAHHLQMIELSADKIRHQNGFLNDVLESLTQPFYVIDADDYTIKLANSAAFAGELPANATCHSISHNRYEPCEDEEHPCPLMMVRETGRPVVVEHLHQDKDGNPRHHEIHCFPIFNGKGRVAQVIEHMWDITDRRLAEQALEKKLDELNGFNELAVGRELRMIELKKEVDALLRELGRQEKYAAETANIESVFTTKSATVS